jgi:hypothetical protein
MNIANLKSFARILTLTCGVMLAISGVTLTRARAQTKTPQTSAPSAEQQKQLDQLKKLNEQLQKDEDAVRSATDRYGWDSNEADAAQQQFFRDRQQYRSLRRSLEAAGLDIPSDAAGARMGSPSSQNGGCCGHGHGHHGCCGGPGARSAHGANCCCGHGT